MILTNSLKRVTLDGIYGTRVLARRLSGREAANPRELFESISDRFWYWLITRGAQGRHGLTGIVPGVPSAEMERNWTGSAGDSTLQEAFDFYRLVKYRAQVHDRAINCDTRVLDFGCGWGRIIRFFLRDVDHWNLHGVDCYGEALTAARRGSRWGHFSLIDTHPPACYRSESFDLIYLYSVFSHLSEMVHLEWLREFQRLLRPGGLLFATTRKRHFIQECAAVRARSAIPAFAAGMAMSFLETEDALRQYDAGEFCHSPTGGGGVLEASFYGETCIPKAYIRREWGKLFRVLDFLDTDPQCPQAVAVIQKP
jgi:SAM-dependent methyltransferase